MPEDAPVWRSVAAPVAVRRALPQPAADAKGLRIVGARSATHLRTDGCA
jgi:hypothetical protein